MENSDPIKVDFRLICAIQRDLKTMVEEGDFRRDLYYRISVFPIELPPLRNQQEELKLLADVLLQRVTPGKALQLSDETI